MNAIAQDLANVPVALVAPLDGRRLIEASAGTGKTWTIAGLVARLVVERGLDISRILVVTFTEAATGELRSRVRAKLIAMRDALDGLPNVDDTFARDWVRRAALDEAQRQRARAQADAAIRNFDDASIYTIHGFCQRALGEFAFAGSTVFDVELTTERDAILAQVVADVWRSRVAQHDATDVAVVPRALHPRFAQIVIDADADPDALAKWMRNLLGHHGVELRGGVAPTGWAQAIAEYDAAWVAVKKVWPDGHAAIDALMRDGTLHKQKYQAHRRAGWLAALDQICTAESPPDLRKEDDAICKALQRWRADVIAQVSGAPPVQHAWFDAVEALFVQHDRYLRANQQLLAWFRRTSYERVGAQLAARMRANRQRGFDDLLVDLDAALDASGGVVAQGLATRYPAMLIDEFQDTDPLQYAIFDKVHAAAPASTTLYFVGDPKQAIYSFRGADLRTYLHARECADVAGTLRENQRATPQLLSALNALFQRREPTFMLDRIAYEPATASRRARQQLRVGARAEAAAFVWLDLRFEPGTSLTVEESTRHAIAATAGSIVELLNDPHATLDARRVAPGDIAVLVNDRFESDAMKRALARRGVGTATRLRDSVFASPEAQMVLVLLTALTRPHRQAALRGALLLDWFGLGTEQLVALDADDARWQPWLECFAQHAHRWHTRGTAPMMRAVLFEHGGYVRIAQGPDGERRLTNIAHLAEALQAEHARLHSTDAVRAWLAASIANERGGTEDELRLDSDANLVQIRTVHTSKGLEYPIVYLPTLWALKPKKAQSPPIDPVLFHEADDCAVIDFDAAPDSVAQAAREAQEERLRLAYVALTRARQRCVVAVGPLSGVETSALGWWLLADGSIDKLDAALVEHVNASGGHAQVQARDCASMSTGVPARLDSAPPVLNDAIVFERTRLEALPTASFTALAQRASEARADSREHDEFASASFEESRDERRNQSADDARFEFPRGADAGDVLHRLFERIDWSADRATWRGAVDTALGRAGFEVDRDRMMAWIDAIARSPLQGACALRDLAVESTRRELEFTIPLDGVDFGALNALARGHAWPLPVIEPGEWQGALRGFIDLVFVHDRRVHVVDYKSNWLGSAIDDYDADAIDRAIDGGGYRLQALLYALAMHRWLRATRGSSYDYEAHFGAVHVLFVRGLDGRKTQKQSALRPSAALIDAIDVFLGAHR